MQTDKIEPLYWLEARDEPFCLRMCSLDRRQSMWLEMNSVYEECFICYVNDIIHYRQIAEAYLKDTSWVSRRIEHHRSRVLEGWIEKLPHELDYPELLGIKEDAVAKEELITRHHAKRVLEVGKDYKSHDDAFEQGRLQGRDELAQENPLHSIAESLQRIADVMEKTNAFGEQGAEMIAGALGRNR